MRLAECGGRIAVQAQHLGERGDAVRPDARVPLEGGRRLGDRAHVVHVVVAAGEQGRAGRRAKRRRVKLVEAEALVGQRIHGRHVYRAAKGA